MGLVTPRHVGSSRTRYQTCVPCISRRVLNCTAREVLRHFQVRSCGDWNSYPCSKISLMLQASLWLWAPRHWGPIHAHPWWGVDSVQMFLRAQHTCVQNRSPLTHTEVYVAEEILEVLFKSRVGIIAKVNATKTHCPSCYTSQDIFNYERERERERDSK